MLDLSDLQYKQVRLPWKAKLLRFLFWFAGTVIVAVIYGVVFQNYYGSPKEKLLTQQVENMKLQYALVGRELDNSLSSLNSFRLSDDVRYRPILDLDTLAESYRRAGYGGVERFRDLNGYINSSLIIGYRTKIEEIKNLSKVQSESFNYLLESAVEWKRELDHMPSISPVSVEFKLGDKFGFRDIHPVLGTPRPHYGQDFEVPYGTKVYATGDGTIVESGWNSGGFGNLVVIDHGYGLKSYYGHLSEITVPKGLNIKRGELIGYSGSTGLSSGPHLHYQIEKLGQHTNPINFFNNDVTSKEFNEMIQEFSAKSIFR